MLTVKTAVHVWTSQLTRIQTCLSAARIRQVAFQDRRSVAPERPPLVGSHLRGGAVRDRWATAAAEEDNTAVCTQVRKSPSFLYYPTNPTMVQSHRDHWGSRRHANRSSRRKPPSAFVCLSLHIFCMRWERLGLCAFTRKWNQLYFFLTSHAALHSSVAASFGFGGDFVNLFLILRDRNRSSSPISRKKRVFVAGIITPEPSPPQKHRMCCIFYPNLNDIQTQQKCLHPSEQVLFSPHTHGYCLVRDVRLICKNIYYLNIKGSQDDNNGVLFLSIALGEHLFCALWLGRSVCEFVAVGSLHVAFSPSPPVILAHSLLSCIWWPKWLLTSLCARHSFILQRRILHPKQKSPRYLFFICARPYWTFAFLHYLESTYCRESEWCGACAQMPSPFFIWSTGKRLLCLTARAANQSCLTDTYGLLVNPSGISRYRSDPQ